MPIVQWPHSVNAVTVLIWDRWDEFQNSRLFLWVGCSGERLKKCRCNRDAIENGRSPDHRDGGDVIELQGL